MIVSRNDFYKYLLEALIVILGVVLALFLSKWSDRRELNENNRETLVQIKDEIISNIDRFDVSIRYHEMIALHFDSIAKHVDAMVIEEYYHNNTSFNHNAIPGWKGIYGARPERIAFESAKLTGTFKEVNFATTRLISSIYDRLDRYDSFNQDILDKFLSINMESKVGDVYIVFSLMKEDMLNFERSLLKDMTETADKIEDIIENNAFKK